MRLIMISLTNNLEIIFSKIGSAMVTMATALFCLNKLLKSLRYFHVVFLSVVLRVKIFNLTIRDTNSKYCSNFNNIL
jgi:hypothetical protein